MLGLCIECSTAVPLLLANQKIFIMAMLDFWNKLFFCWICVFVSRRMTEKRAKEDFNLVDKFFFLKMEQSPLQAEQQVDVNGHFKLTSTGAYSIKLFYNHQFV